MRPLARGLSPVFHSVVWVTFRTVACVYSFVTEELLTKPGPPVDVV